MAKKQSGNISRYDSIALVLQGGGALGAYQVGVYEELFRTPYQPDWVTGVSIGAINSALIVGNPPERRMDRLREFWYLVSSEVSYPAPDEARLRTAFNSWSAGYAAMLGVPGFYRPRFPPALTGAPGYAKVVSVYDTTHLRETLLKLVDFDLINSKTIRLSVGAVDVRTGNSVYFDNFERTITVEHILASGALPPAFAPVEIDGEFYWDGGIVSNTPLQYVLDSRDSHSMLVLQVDLFPARGELPTDLGEVLVRQKDIQYSSRTRYNTDMAAKVQNARQTVRELLQALPESVRSNRRVRELEEWLRMPPVDIVHLIYRQKAYEHESKDYDFSRASVLEHWRAGAVDMRDSLNHPEWLAHSGLDEGVTVYDFLRPSATTNPTPAANKECP